MAAEEVWTLVLAGRAVELADGEIVVGRSRECDLVVRDPSVSRAHTLVSVAGDRLTVQDLGSSNGTLLNGEPVRGETPVAAGDQLRLGRVRLIVGRGPRQAADPGRPECPHCRAPLPWGARACATCGEPVDGERPLSRSEAVSLSDVMPVGEAIASPTRSLDDTRPPFPFAWDDEPALAPAEEAADETELAALDAGSAPGPGSQEEPPAAVAAPPPAGEPVAEADLPPPRPDEGRFLPAAGFWSRAGAFLVDALWIGALGALVTVAAGGPRRPAALAWGGAFALLLSAVVAIGGWSRRGDTPGKRLFRLCVCDLDGRPGIGRGRAAVRWLAYAASALPLGAGFLVAGLTASRRALHDRLAGTYVARIER